MSTETAESREGAACLVESVRSASRADDAFWRSLGDAVGLGAEAPFGLVAALEGRLAGWGEPNPGGRACLYGALRDVGRPVAPEAIMRDAGLRDAEPLAWLDLALEGESGTAERRELILDCLARGGHRLLDLAERVDLVGERPCEDFPAWLARLIRAYPAQMREGVAALLAASFGVDPSDVG